ncbi:NERD domain-containing protein [Flavobacterium agricola]|uniref:NERD domain-containing protein n=1 Tax=Flavobacterium agricola TaxID=2870839 RepID=A0ABY6M3V3_9FLAO|nr:NERD domain-containing protein [Flavobacterium agricola]UYW01718.1 NERD domain-containing protein [Flavobacterium agricola]
MAVTFYPEEQAIAFVENQIYTPEQTHLKGEWMIYRELKQALSSSKDSWYVWHNYHSVIKENHEELGKVETEIDFIILSKYGLLVLEVKGGKIVIANDKFYCQTANQELSEIQNPFIQAQKSKYVLLNQYLQQFKNILVTYAVAFPSLAVALNHPKYNEKAIYSKYTKDYTFADIEQFIVYNLKQSAQNLQQTNRYFPENLSDAVMASVAKRFNVNLSDANVFESFNVDFWAHTESFKIIDALQENPRIMVQGDPGTGKTTLALAYAEKNKQFSGLYVCWNKLLKTSNALKFKTRGLDVDVISYYDFLLQHLPNLTVVQANTFSYEQFGQAMQNAITNYLAQQGKTYDYIIVDEAQDLFDRNLDYFIDKMCVTGKGLTQGRSLLLYDLKQGFDAEKREVDEFEFLLKQYYTHYQLNGNKRSIVNEELQNFALDVSYQPLDVLTPTYYNNKNAVLYKPVNGAKEFKKLVNLYKMNVLKADSSLSESDIVLLFQSSILKNYPQIVRVLKELEIEELTELNFETKYLKYSTPIKFKGLEKKNVVLVVSSPNATSKFEWYMGITRAVQTIHMVHLNF